MSNYHIPDGYVIRPDNLYSDEIGITDNYQNEVYLKALAIAQERGYKKILDVGCGRGFKLVKHFEGYQTLGLDLPPTLAYLWETYPDREWAHVPLDAGHSVKGYDVLICADVIEHILYPDVILDFIRRCAPKVL